LSLPTIRFGDSHATRRQRSVGSSVNAVMQVRNMGHSCYGNTVDSGCRPFLQVEERFEQTVFDTWCNSVVNLSLRSFRVLYAHDANGLTGDGSSPESGGSSWLSRFPRSAPQTVQYCRYSPSIIGSSDVQSKITSAVPMVRSLSAPHGGASVRFGN
jgi:hypothetical protein